VSDSGVHVSCTLKVFANEVQPVLPEEHPVADKHRRGAELPRATASSVVLRKRALTSGSRVPTWRCTMTKSPKDKVTLMIGAGDSGGALAGPTKPTAERETRAHGSAHHVALAR